MISFLMLGSLIFGVLAWVLPFTRLKNNNNMNRAVLSVLSISACAVSLYFQIYYHNYLVKIEDISALMDTMGASTFLCSVLLIVTIIINYINLIIIFSK